MPDPKSARAGFARVVLAGLLTVALTAVASGRTWFRAAVDHKLMPGVRDPDTAADMPLALALSLVVLAAWGALLVTRGRVRRAVAALALVAALGVVACVVVAPFTLPDQVREQLPGASGDVAVSPTGWFVAAAIGAVLATVVLAVAWRQCPTWPTMSTRYDAPATRTAADDTDLWKALDAGHDPTDPSDGPGPSSP
jgi:cytochrome bd-type quinol oxidase subunit 2